VTLPCVSNAASTDYYKAIENVERVSKSLKYIEEDIANKGDAPDIIKQIRFLVKNYNLKENVAASLSTIESSKAREEAKLHGTNAIEDLSQIYEYFSEEMDDMTGKTKPPRDILIFADQATRAADQELKLLIHALPSDITAEVEKQLKSEFEGTS